MRKIKVGKMWFKNLSLIVVVLLAFLMVSCAKGDTQDEKNDQVMSTENNQEDIELEETELLDAQSKDNESEEPIITEEAEISWVDVIMFNGITYEYNGIINPEELSDNSEFKLSLESEFFEVLFNVSNNIFRTDYRLKDGDATYLSEGTKIFHVEGYLHTFRLGLPQGDLIIIYEASQNENAKTLGDLYDIKDKLSYITINSEYDGTTVLATIDNKDLVDLLEDELLASPIIDVEKLLETEEGKSKWRSDRDGERYFLTFYLLDGTSFSKSYWITSGAFGSVATLTEVYGELVTEALNKNLN